MEEKIVDLKEVIGNNISEYRKLSGMSQIEFAEKLNYSDKAISKTNSRFIWNYIK